MTVSITKERRVFMLGFISEWKTMLSYTITQLASLIGLVTFVGTMVHPLKSASAWLMRKRAKLVQAERSEGKMGHRMQFTLDRVHYILDRWRGPGHQIC